MVFKDLQARLRDLEAQLARRRAQHPKMLAAPWSGQVLLLDTHTADGNAAPTGMYKPCK